MPRRIFEVSLAATAVALTCGMLLAPDLALASPAKRRATSSTMPEEPDLPASVPRPLFCPNPDEAPPRKKAVLRCVVQPGVAVSRVLLFFRVPGDETYESVPAVKTPKGWYVAVVPGKTLTGSVLQFYFEGRDATDTPVAENGRSDSPNLMIVRDGARAVTHDDTLGAVRREAEGDGGTPSNDGPVFRVESAPASTEGRRFWVALSVGRGLGFHGTTELEWYGSEISSGTPPSGAFVLWPELGFRVARYFALAVQGRNQVIVHEGSDGAREGRPAEGANAGLLRAILWLPIRAHSSLQLSALGGAGEGFRLVIPPNEVLGRTSSDTVRGGPFIVGAGLHGDIGLSPVWALRLGLEFLRGLSHTAHVLDLGVGVVVSF